MQEKRKGIVSEVCKTLDQYQEEAHLLDRYLEPMMEVLMVPIKVTTRLHAVEGVRVRVRVRVRIGEGGGGG